MSLPKRRGDVVAMKMYKDIDAHIAAQTPKVQKLLRALRTTIHAAAPKAAETISYGIPTFKLNGNLVHFAGYATHIGFYPGAAAITVFAKDLQKYDTAKGTVRFPLDKPLPLALVKKIVTFRVAMQLAKQR